MVIVMTDKQQRFCDEYMANGGNAYQAALSAGYAESTAEEANDWVRAPKTPKNPHKNYKPELAEYIAEHSGEMERHNDRIATAEDLQVFASDVLNGLVSEVVVSASGTAVKVPARISDRLKALDMLAKMKGMYTTKIDANINTPVVIMGYEDIKE